MRRASDSGRRFGAALLARRVALSLSREDVRRLTVSTERPNGIDPSQLSKLERGVSGAGADSVATLTDIARVLGWTFGELVEASLPRRRPRRAA